MNVKPNTDLIDKTQRLYKILEQETLNNYNNKTVIGGLDKLLEFLANDLLKYPVCEIDNLDPITIIKSEFCAAKFEALSPNIPILPRAPPENVSNIPRMPEDCCSKTRFLVKKISDRT